MQLSLYHKGTTRIIRKRRWKLWIFDKILSKEKSNPVQAYSSKNFHDNTHSSYIDSILSSAGTVNNQIMRNNRKILQENKQIDLINKHNLIANRRKI